MSRTVISVEHVSKLYRLGMVSPDMLGQDIKRWWYKLRGKEDPFLKEAITNDRTKKADADFVWALKDINFEVKQGEVLGLIGKNGAGKSTILKILSRVTAPTRGEVKIRGRIASLLEVGTGFQPELSGRENVFLNGAILGLRKKEIEAKFDEIVAFSGVEQYIDTPVKRYSSGMYVRLAFAVAAHLEPEILVVDEVLSVGDVEFQKKCLGKMQDVSSQGRTVVFVSHNMEAVSRLCSRGILFDKGKLEFDGSSVDCIQEYIRLNENLATSFNLNERKDRRGTGEFQFSNVWFTDANGNNVTNFKVGENVNIHTIIQQRGRKPDEKAFASVALYDSKGFRVCSFGSAINHEKVELQDKTEIIWKLENFRLTPDEYFGELFLYKNPGGVDMIDHISEGFKLIILPGDFYRTGVVPNKGRDKVFIDFSYSVR